MKSSVAEPSDLCDVLKPRNRAPASRRVPIETTHRRRIEPATQCMSLRVPPVEKIPSFLELLGTSGPHERDQRPESQAILQADAVWLSNLDRKHYGNGPRTDADGRIMLPDLIPGALYRIGDYWMVNDDERGTQSPKDFSVKPGETVDLGEIQIGK